MYEITMRVFAYIGIGVSVVAVAGVTAIIGLVLIGRHVHGQQVNGETVDTTKEQANGN